MENITQKSHFFHYTKHESFKYWINIVSYIANKIIDILSIRIKNCCFIKNSLTKFKQPKYSFVFVIYNFFVKMKN